MATCNLQSITTSHALRRLLPMFGLVLAATSAAPAAEPTADNQAAQPRQTDPVDGAELFAREWLPGDASPDSDGLGPMFNESSCIACHNQGGPGGGGPAGKNVDILTATMETLIDAFVVGRLAAAGVQAPAPAVLSAQTQTFAVPRQVPRPTFLSPVAPAEPVAGVAFPTPPAVQKDIDPQQDQLFEQLREQRKQNLEQLVKLHPGFRHARSVVLHRYGTFASYDVWRRRWKQGLAQVAPPVGLLGLVNVDEPVLSEVDVDRPQGGSNPQSANPTLQPDDESSLRQQAVFQPVAANPPFLPPLQPDNTTTSTGSLLDDMQQTAIEVHGRSRQNNTTIQIGQISVQLSQRNPTALFGAGRIDSIPDKLLVLGAQKRFPNYPLVSGRVSRLKDGKIGRFGWKAQVASLRDFTLTACAVELGLNVPGHAQAGIPQKPDYQAVGNDLNDAECNALIKYIAELPAPVEITPANNKNAEFVAAGHQLFERIGCAACHAPSLGEVKGIYSDLLLHDMGPELGDVGSSYGIFVPSESSEAPLPELVDADQKERPEENKPIAATQLEWRTPPLWGVRDSAPYMHDGRAETLDEAIAVHGGEALKSAQMYFALLPAERMQVLAMLKSLVADK